MDFAILVVTASTILVAAALTVIAFLLNRDFRKQLKTFENEQARLKELEYKFQVVSSRIDRNVARDNASILILQQLISDLLNAEKFQEFLNTHPSKGSEEYKAAENARSIFTERTRRRMWEVELLASTRLDKRQQLLSEMIAEPADRDLMEFLERSASFFEDDETKKLIETSQIVARERSRLKS